MKKILLTAAALFLMMGSAHAFTPVYSSTGNNFTVLDPEGASIGGNNTYSFTWDGTYKTISNGVANATLSSTTKFFSFLWVASNVEILAPGSYSWDTAVGGGNPESGMMNLTVGAGQVGAHMLWDWGNGMNIDVAVLWNINQVWQDPTGQGDDVNDLTVGGTNSTATVFTLSSVDGNGDGINGIPMAAGGPFGGFSFNYNIKGLGNFTPPPQVPEPASLLLIGSGLAGLVGLARGRRRCV